MERLETLTLLYFRHCLKNDLKFLYRARDVAWIRLCFFCLFFCVEETGKFAEGGLSKWG